MNLTERLAAQRRSIAVNAPPATVSDSARGRLRESVHERVLDGIASRGSSLPATDDLSGEVRAALTAALSAESPHVGAAERSRLALEVADDLIGHGPLEPLLRDDSVSEIMVNGSGQVFVERAGRLTPVAVRFADDRELRRTIDRMVSRVGRRVDESSPMVDARLPDGSRINVVLPPLALDGPLLTIRRFTAEPHGIEDLVSFGTLTTLAAEFLAAAVRGRLNLLVSGSTGAGKTTTLNVLSGFIPAHERIVTIEDTAELRLQQQHVARLEGRPPNVEGHGEVTIRQLVRNALRMRPDRIVLGEVRDAAAIDMITAMSTGHDGSICTVHANGARDALARIETMALMGAPELPLRAIREQVVGAIDLVVHQARNRQGHRHVTSITEVMGLEGDIITVQEIFDTDPADESLQPTGIRPRCLDRLVNRGVDISRVDLRPSTAVAGS